MKLEAGGATGSLTAISQHTVGEPVPFRDDTLGVSLTTPADWIVHPRNDDENFAGKMILLLEPNGGATGAGLRLVQKETLNPGNRVRQ